MKILFLCKNTSEANAWYRSSGIATNLEKLSGHDIDVVNWQDIQPIMWDRIIRYDIIMVQRPFTSEDLALCRYIKECGVKLWIDHDDNLLDLNPENKYYNLYNRQEIKANIINIIKIADVLTVTTRYLKAAYKKYSKNIIVIPNAFNDDVIKRKLQIERKNVVFWRGADSHLYNLLSYGAGMNKAIENFPGWDFYFMGYYPWMLSDKKLYIEPQDIIIYFKTIAKISPSVVHVPLFPDNFNVCRSNISVIEGAYAGAVCIVPEFWLYKGDEKVPGTISYSNSDSYYEAIRSCCNGEVDIAKGNNETWEYIMDNLLLSKVNKLRANLIKNL